MNLKAIPLRWVTLPLLPEEAGRERAGHGHVSIDRRILCDSMCRGEPRGLLPVGQQEVTRVRGNEKNMFENSVAQPGSADRLGIG
ncbi:hypothetical protein NQZ68_029165 [Dissostichus eleginoides]|nr:hypothetical protein NQZ68_029165 [Dissostichus eleginoides]